MLDDYALISGETKAIDDYFKNHDVNFEKYPFFEKPTYIRKN